MADKYYLFRQGEGLVGDPFDDYSQALEKARSMTGKDLKETYILTPITAIESETVIKTTRLIADAWQH